MNIISKLIRFYERRVLLRSVVLDIVANPNNRLRMYVDSIEVRSPHSTKPFFAGVDVGDLLLHIPRSYREDTSIYICGDSLWPSRGEHNMILNLLEDSLKETAYLRLKKSKI